MNASCLTYVRLWAARGKYNESSSRGAKGIATLCAVVPWSDDLAIALAVNRS
jgi:hypothetical protein